MQADDGQRRYRWTSFFIDTMRNVIRNENLPEAVRVREAEQQKELLAATHGEMGIDAKFQRWMQLTPPSLCAPPEYHELLVEAESAFVQGAFYPALTAACCVGERVLNELVLGLRKHYRASDRYKEVARKGSLQRWETAISILSDWLVLEKHVASKFERLLELRNPAVHFGTVHDREARALEAVQLVYDVTDALFGQAHDRFFWAPGEPYVKRSYEADPVTIEFVVPHCIKAGHRHTVEDRAGQLVIQDPGPYDDQPLTDDEFVERRTEWQKPSRTG